MNDPQVTATLELVGGILDEIGRPDASADDPLLGADATDYGRFIRRFSIRTGCIPYPLDQVADLTIAGFCDLYVSESYPEPPTTRLGDGQYDRVGPPRAERVGFDPVTDPVCFVLGCGRSGTTLFQAMLGRHPDLWAPGELHLAQFDTMAERATGLPNPFLRHALVPEAAERFGESPEAFTDRLTAWEHDGLPITDVYRQLQGADPHTVVVDKTPPYSGTPEDLDWIVRHFPEARFLHIVRRPHDVIRSFVRMQLHKGSAGGFERGLAPHHVAEAVWVRHNENIAAALAPLPDDRWALVRYEDLVDGPAVPLAGACTALGLVYEPAMADPYAGAVGPVASGAGDPRVNLLNEVERRPPSPPTHPLGRRCAELAARFGY